MSLLVQTAVPRQLARILVVALTIACSPAQPADAVPTLARWTLGLDPSVQIGTVEGESALQFFEIAGIVRLADGGIVVLDAGAAELRYFASDGRFIARAGRRGGGPGEFRWPAHIFSGAGDTVRVFDRNRFSVFDSAGQFVRTEPAAARDTATPFPLHIWLHRRHLIVGGTSAAERASIRTALSRAAPAMTGAPWHVVQIGPEGELWIGAPQDGIWRVADSTGRMLAEVGMPQGFELHEVHADALIGRWRDTDGVEFVRVHPLRRDSGSTVRISPRSAHSSTPIPLAAAGSVEELAVRTSLESGLRQLVTAQEAYYARRGRYATHADSLPRWWPELVELTLYPAGPGWFAVAAHPGADMICVMAVGRPPGGWAEGMPLCG